MVTLGCEHVDWLLCLQRKKETTEMALQAQMVLERLDDLVAPVGEFLVTAALPAWLLLHVCTVRTGSGQDCGGGG
jgi:hypothetical protein